MKEHFVIPNAHFVHCKSVQFLRHKYRHTNLYALIKFHLHAYHFRLFRKKKIKISHGFRFLNNLKLQLKLSATLVCCGWRQRSTRATFVASPNCVRWQQHRLSAAVCSTSDFVNWRLRDARLRASSLAVATWLLLTTMAQSA